MLVNERWKGKSRSHRKIQRKKSKVTKETRVTRPTARENPAEGRRKALIPNHPEPSQTISACSSNFDKQLDLHYLTLLSPHVWHPAGQDNSQR